MLPLWVLFSTYSLACEFLVTECTGGTRKSIQYGDCTGVTGTFPCDLDCRPGTYLGKTGCELCGAGTSSKGVVQRLGPNGLPWANVKELMFLWCERTELPSFDSIECEPWHTDENSLVLPPARASGNYRHSILYPFSLVKDGSFEIVYMKDSVSFNGEFRIQLDKDVLLVDNQTSSSWQTFHHNVSAGNHELKLSYVYKAQDDHTFTAKIVYIEIAGVGHAALYCEECWTGWSSPGATTCQICDTNEYYSTEEEYCLLCPEGTTAPKGSTELYSCVPAPSCVAANYEYFYSECENNLSTKSYAWKDYQVCNRTSGVSLPADETTECRECVLGYYRDTGSFECKACAEGHWLNGTLCEECPEGSRAENIFHLRPGDDFIMSIGGLVCWNERQRYCKSDWEITTEYIGVPEDHRDSDTYNLGIWTTLNAQAAELHVEYELFNITEGNFTVYNNRRELVTARNEVGKQELLAHIDSKHMFLELEFAGIAPFHLRIYSIKLTGTELGSAITCNRCPEHQTTHHRNDAHCHDCPPGLVPSPAQDSCIQCEGENYAARTCRPCPESTIPSFNNSYCRASSNLTLGRHKFYIQPLSGSSTTEGEYKNGSCGDSLSALYCRSGFYGPISDSQASYFISVMNPSVFKLHEYEIYQENEIGYAFGVFDGSVLGLPADNDCYQKTLVNLGKEMHILPTSTGFVVHYINGDPCPSSFSDDTNSFQAELNFTCDKAAEVGWPLLQEVKGCIAHFTWSSRYACHICESEELERVETKCVNGTRDVEYREGDDCVLPGIVNSTVEFCNVNIEALGTPIAIIGIFLAFVLSLIILFLCYRCTSFKQKYSQLTEVKLPST